MSDEIPRGKNNQLDLDALPAELLFPSEMGTGSWGQDVYNETEDDFREARAIPDSLHIDGNARVTTITVMCVVCDDSKHKLGNRPTQKLTGQNKKHNKNKNMSKYFIHLHKVHKKRGATRTAGKRSRRNYNSNENVHKIYIANTQLSPLQPLCIHWLFDWLFKFTLCKIYEQEYFMPTRTEPRHSAG